MGLPLQQRDPGLQPERTVLSWQRTAFSALVLALFITRAGFRQEDILLGGLGGLSALLALVLVVLTLQRQRTVMCDTNLCSYGAIVTKGLISTSLALNALAITLHSLIYLVCHG